jgi:hypothetical protein
VASLSGTTAILNWTDTSTNEASFSLERSTNGVDFSEIAVIGANLTTYTNSGLASAMPYFYRLRAWNNAGYSAYSTVAPVSTAGALRIVAQPQSATNAPGSAATFVVAAGGTAPLYYQWYHASTNLPGRTSYTLSLVNVSNVNAGEYRVAVWNGSGSVTSAPAVLTLTGGAQEPVMVAAPVMTNGQFTVVYQATPGQTYTIQFKESLLDPVWQEQAKVQVPPSGLLLLQTDPTAGPQRFYRVIGP